MGIGLTQQQLAKAAKITMATLNHVENGHGCRMTTINRIVDALSAYGVKFGGNDLMLSVSIPRK